MLKPDNFVLLENSSKTRHFCANTDIPLKKYKMVIEAKNATFFVVAATAKLDTGHMAQNSFGSNFVRLKFELYEF